MIISSYQHENLKITIKQWVLSFLSIIIISICNQPHKVNAGIGCTGKFVNPITDVCWNCLFPITLIGIEIVGGGGVDTKSTKDPICFCWKKRIGKNSFIWVFLQTYLYFGR